jgi:hypothetical protein
MPEGADMNITTTELFATITPLVVALHEKGVLDIAEVPHYYEDAVVRRKDMGATDAEVAYQQELVAAFQRLAQTMKAQGRNQPR